MAGIIEFSTEEEGNLLKFNIYRGIGRDIGSSIGVDRGKRLIQKRPYSETYCRGEFSINKIDKNCI